MSDISKPKLVVIGGSNFGSECKKYSKIGGGVEGMLYVPSLSIPAHEKTSAVIDSRLQHHAMAISFTINQIPLSGWFTTIEGSDVRTVRAQFELVEVATFADAHAELTRLSATEPHLNSEKPARWTVPVPAHT